MRITAESPGQGVFWAVSSAWLERLTFKLERLKKEWFPNKKQSRGREFESRTARNNGIPMIISAE